MTASQIRSEIPPLLEVVVTARPSWARVKSLVNSYRDLVGEDFVRVTLVGPAVSKRYGDISNNLPKWLKFDAIPALNESDSLSAVALSCIHGSAALVNKWSISRPDCVLVIADRTETLGVSVAASIMQIPLIHLQGGEISGSIDDKIRDANTKLADLHLTTNSETANRLESIGEKLDLIRIVGCPSIDIVSEVIDSSEHFAKNYSSDLGGVGSVFSLNEKFGMIMFHPDTFNDDENVIWAKLLINLTVQSELNWIWFWPNPDHGSHAISHEIRAAREAGLLTNVRFVINLQPEDFVKLAVTAKIMIGNSSFGIREASFIGLPVINIGARQSGRQKAENVQDCPNLITSEEFKRVMLSQLSVGRFKSSEIYGSGDSGLKAAMAIRDWVPQLKSR